MGFDFMKVVKVWNYVESVWERRREDLDLVGLNGF